MGSKALVLGGGGVAGMAWVCGGSRSPSEA